MLPRPRRIQNDRIFNLEEDRLIEPAENGSWVRVREAPSPADAKALREYTERYGANVVVELAADVPLSALEHAQGAAFVILTGGRASFEGLEALPASVRRLSVRRQAKAIPLGGLKKHRGLEELELDGPAIAGDGPAFPSLRTLAWTRAKDAGLAFLERQPALVHLGLHTSAVTRLPDAPSVERLLLFYPTGLSSLPGIGRLKKLAFLRIDQPKGMKRLGDLSTLRALRSVLLVRAHAIEDLSGLATIPELETLNVLHSKLAAKPFLGLRGKLKRGYFHLRSLQESRALMAHLGVPQARLEAHEPALFDF
ncbi:MAG: hypothetical protein JNL21_24100 [Myxococcales bacterium]|nr:hypothetical protein [Myxococcales bacterium]